MLKVCRSFSLLKLTDRNLLRLNEVSPHVRESKTVLDSGFHPVDVRIPGTGFQYLSVELGLLIPIFSMIPDSLSCIPDSKTPYSGFHKQKCLGFRSPDPITWDEKQLQLCAVGNSSTRCCSAISLSYFKPIILPHH